MASYDFDLFVIGAGSGGVRAARMAAQTGARVAVAEERYLGGTCVNVGCVPKKLLVYASHFHEHLRDAEAFGLTASERVMDWARLIANKDVEISRLNGVYAGLLEKAGVLQLDGHAKLVNEYTVEVEGKHYTAENLLIATGSWPRTLDIPGAEHVITSNEAFFIKDLPQRAIVVGGGYIGVEFAGIFNGMGSRTTLVHRGDHILRGFDMDVRSHVQEAMAAKGIAFQLEDQLKEVIREENGSLTAVMAGGSVLQADVILSAVGRVPLTEGLGLEYTGVTLDSRDAIVVDAHSRSNVPNIFAIGDVTNRMNLTPVAIAEAMALVQTLYHDNPTAPEYHMVPSAVFSQPEVGTVGYTEEEAREKFGEIDVYRSRFRSMKNTLTGSEEKTLMKLIVDRATDMVVGMHMVGDNAGEIMQGFAVALRGGATKAQFDATVGIHPTAAEEFVTMRDPVS